MPPKPQEAFWPWYEDLLETQGQDRRIWSPRSLDIKNDMDRLKDFVLTHKKVIVVGGQYSSPLSHSNINQIMREDEKAWDGMDPRKMQMIHVYDYYMGGDKAAKLFHFGDVDHLETIRELIDGWDASLDTPQLSSDALSKLAEDMAREDAFKNVDVLVIDYDKSFITMADPTSFDNSIKYVSRRVDRAIDAIEALVKAVIPKMPNGARIIVLTNSLWTLAITESSYHDNLLASKNQALMKQLAQEVKEKHGIEMSFLQNQIASMVRPIKWPSLCNTINYFNHNGYTLDMQRRVGSRIASIAAFGQNGPTKQEMDTIYDRVLSKMLFEQRFSDGRVQERRLWSRGELNIRCTAERYGAEYGPQNTLGEDSLYEDPDLDGAVLRRMQDLDVTPQRRQPTEDSLGGTIALPTRPKVNASAEHIYEAPTPYVEGTTKIWLNKVREEKVFEGRVALVLDTGRYDGITTQVCQELARLGAKVALTYVDEGDNAANAKEIVEKIRLDGGEATALEGLPHRSAKHSDKENEQDRYIRDLVFGALRAFKAKQLHIIVSNAGCDYSLQGKTFQEKKELIYVDSVRNMLALNYAIEVCDDCGLLGDGGRVINMAGMGTNPATAVDRLPFWDHASMFAEYWYGRINQPSRNTDAYVTFNTFAPSRALDFAFQPVDTTLRDRWWVNVEESRELYFSQKMVEETAKLVGWLARPTSTLHAVVVMPSVKDEQD